MKKKMPGKAPKMPKQPQKPPKPIKLRKGASK
jgi:hypothetical protein